MGSSMYLRFFCHTRVFIFWLLLFCCFFVVLDIKKGGFMFISVFGIV